MMNLTSNDLTSILQYIPETQRAQFASVAALLAQPVQQIGDALQSNLDTQLSDFINNAEVGVQTGQMRLQVSLDEARTQAYDEVFKAQIRSEIMLALNGNESAIQTLFPNIPNNVVLQTVFNMIGPLANEIFTNVQSNFFKQIRNLTTSVLD